MVGNGDNIRCDGWCQDLIIEMGRTSFTIPFFILPVERVDLILGLAWLRTLGPILVDFSVPQITFTVGPKSITLQGEPLSTPISAPTLKTLLQKESVVSLHMLHFYFEPLTSPKLSSPKTQSDPNIDHLLQTYTIIFDKPPIYPHHTTKTITSQTFHLRYTSMLSLIGTHITKTVS